MCYDITYLTRKAAKYAERYGEKADWEDLMKKITPVYHVKGFVEPDIPVINNKGAIGTMVWHPFAPIKWANTGK